MSDYFVWESRRRPSEALIAEFPPTQKQFGVSFLVGRRFLVELPELEAVMDGEQTGAVTDDLVVRKHRCLAHSGKLQQVLRTAGVTNIDYYPMRIVNPTTGAVFRSHAAANILDVIHCIDRDASDLEIDDENPENLWYINRLVLLKDRLGDVPLFRLGERLRTVIVRRDVKEAVERAGITGAMFLPAEGYREYHGFAFNNPRNVIGTHDDDPDGPAGARPVSGSGEESSEAAGG